ncbi:hypothetical protein QP905_08100 [Corynebacterium pseudodiphtheriticum]|uniref:hypothetical protein n=1 Tax=Corynebacterium pseudodiphtheriticum TaxID=37637 RepID=UPI002551B617|nr:hypothetical protein [Corynebacterium pseudodiphtheriticum]MDK8578307.1 hypothetical protein [Corynebacterium pseudodiphtheriticum]
MTRTIATPPILRLHFSSTEQAQLWLMDMLQRLEIPVYGLDWTTFLKDHLLQSRQDLAPVMLCIRGGSLVKALKEYRVTSKGAFRA